MLAKQEIKTFDKALFSSYVCDLMKEEDKYRKLGTIMDNIDQTSDIDSDFIFSGDEDTSECE